MHSSSVTASAVSSVAIFWNDLSMGLMSVNVTPPSHVTVRVVPLMLWCTASIIVTMPVAFVCTVVGVSVRT